MMINSKAATGYLGVDLGRRAAGLAYSPDGKIIVSAGRIEFEAIDQFFSQLKAVIEEKQPTKIVFGLPLNKEGEKTNQSGWVKETANKLAERIEVPIEYIDEYLTTWGADQSSNEEIDLDQGAAKIILTDYLEKNV